jgi:hypothetical protein
MSTHSRMASKIFKAVIGSKFVALGFLKFIDFPTKNTEEIDCQCNHFIWVITAVVHHFTQRQQKRL